MKKRILSLFLALAMVATAGVAVPGIQAEAASNVASIGSGIVTASGLTATTQFAIEAKSANGGERVDDNLKVGDTLSIKDFGTKNKTFPVRVKLDNGEVVAANADNVNIQWVSAGKDKEFEAIEGATDATYTVTADDINNIIGVVLWVPGADLPINNSNTRSGKDITDFEDLKAEVLKDLDSFKAKSGSALNTANVAIRDNDSYRAVAAAGDFQAMFDKSSASDAIYAVWSIYGYPVDKERVTTVAEGGILDIKEAMANDGSELIQIGNTLVVANSQLWDSNGNLKRLKLTFKVKDGISNKDVWGRKTDDQANGTSSDPLVWSLIEQETKSNLSVKPAAGQMESDFGLKNIDSIYVTYGGITLNTNSRQSLIKTGVTYDIWVKSNTGEKGDKYDMTSAVQSHYSLIVVDSWDLIAVLDLNGGDLPGALTDRYKFNQYNVKNNVAKTLDKIGVRSVDTTDNLADEGQHMFDLPTLPKKGDEFFQGWSESGRNGTVMSQTSNLVARYNKLYTAIWGDTEVKNQVVVGGKALYRLYNPNNGEHLYTAQPSEVAGLTAIGWIEETTTFNGLAEGGTVVYRLYNPNSGEHHYVVEGSNEMNVLIGAGWLNDGDVFRTGNAGVPMFRLWNGQAGPGSHHLTTDVNEYNVLATQGWKQEGVKFSGVK